MHHDKSLIGAFFFTRMLLSCGLVTRGPLPDVLRLVIDGKRMLAVQLQQVSTDRTWKETPRNPAEELTEVQQFAEAEKNNFAQA